MCECSHVRACGVQFLPTVGLFIAWVSTQVRDRDLGAARVLHYFKFPVVILNLCGLSCTQIGASPTSVNCFLDWDAAEGWWANGLFYGTPYTTPSTPPLRPFFGLTLSLGCIATVEFTIIVCVSFVTLNLAIIRLLTIHGFAGFHKYLRAPNPPK